MFDCNTNIKPINAGMTKFITQRVKVDANIANELLVENPQIYKAISLRANSPTNGGSGIPVCNK